MTWNTADEMVGRNVLIYTCPFDGPEPAKVLAVSETTTNIKVELQDGTVMAGNVWEDID